MTPASILESAALAATDAYSAAHVDGASEHSHTGTWHCSRCEGATPVDTFVRVTIRDGVAEVAFGGTDKGLDWWTNLAASHCPRWRGYAHAGFAHAWDSVAEEVFDNLAQQELRSIVVRGHSLGGALALLAAIDIAGGAVGVPVECVTFGAPRAVSEKLRGYGESLPNLTVTRVVNGPDPVTWLPPLSLGFRHMGAAVQLRRRASLLALGNWFAGRLLHRQYHPIDAYWTALQEARL